MLTAELCGGLYLLKESTSLHPTVPSPSYVFQSIFNSMSISNENEVMLWPFRLGYPNFMYLENLFPHLFDNRNPNSYHCETCQLAKHTRHVYSSIPYTPSYPFSIIHSDI